MGTYSRLILLLVCPSEPLEFSNLEPPPGVRLVLLRGGPRMKSIAKVAANKVAEILQAVRERSLGLGAEGAPGVAAFVSFLFKNISGVAERATPYGITPGEPEVCYQVHDDEQTGEPPSPEALVLAKRGRGPSLPIFAPPPSPASVKMVEDQARGILDAFLDLAPESHVDLEHELKFLVEEYRRGHYTACALRGGRTLEFVVYELSRRWNIKIQDDAHGRLQQLQEGLDRAGDLLGDFQVSEGEDAARLRKEVRDAFKGLALKAMEMFTDFDETKSGRAEALGKAPRTIPTLVKKALKRYGHLEGVKQELYPLISKGPEGGLIRRVLDVRNKAAHANADGGREEADQDTVRTLLADILGVTLRLSNVHMAIHRAAQMA